MFKSKEKWAFDPEVRQAISALDLMDRCLEEVKITMGEVKNYMDWATLRIDGIKDMMKDVPLDSYVGGYLRIAGSKTGDSLKGMFGLGKVDLKWAGIPDEFSKELQGSASFSGVNAKLIEWSRLAQVKHSDWLQTLSESQFVGSSLSAMSDLWELEEIEEEIEAYQNEADLLEAESNIPDMYEDDDGDV